MSQYPYLLIPDVLQNMRNEPISQPILPKKPQKPEKPLPLPPEPQIINIQRIIIHSGSVFLISV